jgi:hypothetical protein
MGTWGTSARELRLGRSPHMTLMLILFTPRRAFFTLVLPARSRLRDYNCGCK